MSNDTSISFGPTEIPTLKDIINYVAAEDCCEGGSPPTVDCDCVCCEAARLREKLWPATVMRVADAIRVFEDDLLPVERRHWEDNGRPLGHHYVAMVALISAAKMTIGEDE